VDGRVEQFRLVGMDHFNAMFEDSTTKSWWRQVNGEAVTGAAKGKVLPEIPSMQVTLAQWLALHPNTLIMQPDSALAHKYSKTNAFETGESRKALTGTDTISWNEKAWVVGVSLGGESKAYDWNRLRRERVVNDVVGGRPIVVVLAADSTNFFALERPDSATRFILRGDSIAVVGGRAAYAFTGRGAQGMLRQISASQEFWHSWRSFHPNTATY